MVVTQSSASELRNVALGEGMRTIRQDGWEKIRMGVTTVDEVMRVTMEEELMREFHTDKENGVASDADELPVGLVDTQDFTRLKIL